MATAEEYKLREAEFMARTDALCDDMESSECDCSNCPCKELCDWLYENDPFYLQMKEKERKALEATDGC